MSADVLAGSIGAPVDMRIEVDYPASVPVPSCSRDDRGRSVVRALASVLAGSMLACAVTPQGATDAHLALAKNRAVQGGKVFDAACATCHGPRGEGLAGAPPIIGITGLPRYPRDQAGVQLFQDPNQIQRQNQQRVPGAPSRVEFVTARDVYDYLRQHMSLVKRPSLMTHDLSESDTWAVVNFVLIAHGSDVPEAGISAANADHVLIRSE